VVKDFLKVFILSLLLFIGCNIDFFGFVISSDLDDRLAEKNSLKFLVDKGWTTLSLPDEYSFIVVTDTHIEDGRTWGLEKLSAVINSHNTTAGNTQIEFVVITGDITQYGSEQDIKKFIEIADSLEGIPCYPVIGNHDVYFDNWHNWRDNIGSTRYRIDGGKATLFILDSANAFFGKEQLDWLERELKKYSGNVFVFTHYPPFVEGPVTMSMTDLREQARIVSMLKDKCKIMFTGHSHIRYFYETGNVRYVTIEDFRSNSTYCIVTVKGSSITYELKKL
jgi:3',5'-cyclic AMP phosphodiesterase CpdA